MNRAVKEKDDLSLCSIHLGKNKTLEALTSTSIIAHKSPFFIT